MELAGKRVAVIGTGATGVQVIGEIADKVGDLTVFQRRPNWCAPLHNAEISAEEMADIKSRYDEIFAICARTPGGFIHEPDRRPFFEVPREERLAKWEKLYGEPGFGIWLANFRDIFMNEEANAEFSEFIADKIRSRVNDPVVAEKLIPKDHGFGVQRVPLETRYYEAYNRDNVHLVDLKETPIERITPNGHPHDRAATYEFDIIVYATGFDAVTGAYDRIDIRGVGGQSLKDKWATGPRRTSGCRSPASRTCSCRPARRAARRRPTSPRHRARRRLGHRPDAAHVGERLHPRGGHAGGRGGLGRLRGQALRHPAHAQGAGLVHRVQLERRGPREGHDPLPRVQRRHAQVPGQDHRGGGDGLPRHPVQLTAGAPCTSNRPQPRSAPSSPTSSWRSLTDAEWAEIDAAFLEHAVLVFPGPAPERRRAGRLRPALRRAVDRVDRVHQLRRGRQLLPPDDPLVRHLAGNEGWHTDCVVQDAAAKASMLSAQRVPSAGGETEWADMRAAYDALDDATRQRVAGLSAYHSLYYSQARIGIDPSVTAAANARLAARRRPGAGRGGAAAAAGEGPPRTGRPALFIGRHAYGIPGLDPASRRGCSTSWSTLPASRRASTRHQWRRATSPSGTTAACSTGPGPTTRPRPASWSTRRVAGDPATEHAEMVPAPPI